MGKRHHPDVVDRRERIRVLAVEVLREFGRPETVGAIYYQVASRVGRPTLTAAELRAELERLVGRGVLRRVELPAWPRAVSRWARRETRPGYELVASHSPAWRAGFAALQAHEGRTGRCNVNPSPADLAEWADHEHAEFRAGWNAAKIGN